VRTLTGEKVDLDGETHPFVPTVFLYDNFPGGIGLSVPLYDLRDTVVAQALDLVRRCSCKQGCPACVGPILATEEERGYSPKQAATTVLQLFAL
jgi:DEAD/DEAH box helicase domain-containing protein